jgi:hypothetical protein
MLTHCFPQGTDNQFIDPLHFHESRESKACDLNKKTRLAASLLCAEGGT